jgi:hypothetical protein
MKFRRNNREKCNELCESIIDDLSNFNKYLKDLFKLIELKLLKVIFKKIFIIYNINNF